MKWFGVGLLIFGFALGFLTGLSTFSGISHSLLSAVFAFVGGVLLSYAGLSRARRARAVAEVATTPKTDPKAAETEPPARPDLRAVGISLASLSLGLLVGLISG